MRRGVLLLNQNKHEVVLAKKIVQAVIEIHAAYVQRWNDREKDKNSYLRSDLWPGVEVTYLYPPQRIHLSVDALPVVFEIRPRRGWSGWKSAGLFGPESHLRVAMVPRDITGITLMLHNDALKLGHPTRST